MWCPDFDFECPQRFNPKQVRRDAQRSKKVNIVRFEMNVPTEVALQSPQGTLVAGRYGDRVMFPLADGRVMYVPPVVAAQIDAKGILVGGTLPVVQGECKSRPKSLD